MTDVDLKGKRPISPHIQNSAYKVTFSMMVSMSHRITGMALYVGTLLLTYWLIALASGDAAFETAQSLFGSILGRLVLLGYTWAMIHHILGGIRHFIWDVPTLMEKHQLEWLYRLTVVLSFTLTALLWAIAYVFFL